MMSSAVQSAVAVALALQELDHLKAMGLHPTVEQLQERLRARGADFDLVVKAAAAFLQMPEAAR